MPEAGAPDLHAMMQELGGSDPRMAMLMQFLQPQRAQAVADDPALDERNAVIEDLSARLDAAEDRLHRMDTIARRLHSLHQAASRRLSELAAALGACGLCWGEDDQCPGCRGRGRAGMVRPDPEVRARLLGARSPSRSSPQFTPMAQEGEE
jgi:hypothetical protein